MKCSTDQDCAGLVRNTTDPSAAKCASGFCEHGCMEQYRGAGALPALAQTGLENWCGGSNNGVPWGSVCVKDGEWRPGEVPVQCALPCEAYQCPWGWGKALWNNGEAAPAITCQWKSQDGAWKESKITCYGEGAAPCCQKSRDARGNEVQTAQCGGCL